MPITSFDLISEAHLALLELLVEFLVSTTGGTYVDVVFDLVVVVFWEASTFNIKL